MPSPRELSSAKSDWRTPPYIFEWLDREFKFNLDAAASIENALCDHFFTEEDDALSEDWRIYRDWHTRAFVNPPYGKAGHAFLRKAREESQRDVMSVLLIPPSTGTIAWHRWASKASEIRFLRPRIAFLDSSGRPIPSNTRDSCLVIFRPGCVGTSPLVSFVERPQAPHEQRRKEAA